MASWAHGVGEEPGWQAGQAAVCPVPGSSEPISLQPVPAGPHGCMSRRGTALYEAQVQPGSSLGVGALEQGPKSIKHGQHWEPLGLCWLWPRSAMGRGASASMHSCLRARESLLHGRGRAVCQRRRDWQ